MRLFHPVPLAVLIFAACLVPSARSSDDAAGPVLADAAHAADGIETSLNALDRSADELHARDAARCRDGFTMDGFMRHLDQNGLTSDGGIDMATIENHSLCYYQCRAYAGHDSALCDPMKAFKIMVGMAGGHLPGNLACMDHIYDLHFVRALIMRSAEFQDACRQNLLHGLVRADDLTPAAMDSYCSTVLAKADDPAALCKAVGPALFQTGKRPEQAAKCVLFFRGVHGDAKACEELPSESHIKERCFGYAAFYTAFHAGDQKLCGNDPICNIFFGSDGEACQPYATHIGTVVCRDAPNYADPELKRQAGDDEQKLRSERTRLAEGPLRELKTRLDALAAGLPGASGVNRAAADALRLRYEALVKRTSRTSP